LFLVAKKEKENGDVGELKTKMGSLDRYRFLITQRIKAEIS